MIRCVVVLFIMFFFNESNAKDNGYFSPHDLCEHSIEKMEKERKIPNRLLMAIGSVESGRLDDQTKQKRPWPWTICVAGKSHYFSTKSAAIAAAKRIRASGVKNMDVGCMQINLLHHKNAFKNLEEAFTPMRNVEYAAAFLTDLKNQYNSWTKAVGYYHSKLEKYYVPYCANVYKAWSWVSKRVINNSEKVRLKSEEKSHVSYLPSYYALIDKRISDKLHKLSKMSLARNIPKFREKRKK